MARRPADKPLDRADPDYVKALEARILELIEDIDGLGLILNSLNEERLKKLRPAKKKQPPKRVSLGVRVLPDLLHKLKVEAARRDKALRELVEEILTREMRNQSKLNSMLAGLKREVALKRASVKK